MLRVEQKIDANGDRPHTPLMCPRARLGPPAVCTAASARAPGAGHRRPRRGKRGGGEGCRPATMRFDGTTVIVTGAGSGILVLGTHFATPAAGRTVRAGDSYRFALP